MELKPPVMGLSLTECKAQSKHDQRAEESIAWVGEERMGVLSKTMPHRKKVWGFYLGKYIFMWASTSGAGPFLSMLG